MNLLSSQRKKKEYALLSLLTLPSPIKSKQFVLEWFFGWPMQCRQTAGMVFTSHMQMPKYTKLQYSPLAGVWACILLGSQAGDNMVFTVTGPDPAKHLNTCWALPMWIILPISVGILAWLKDNLIKVLCWIGAMAVYVMWAPYLQIKFHGK